MSDVIVQCASYRCISVVTLIFMVFAAWVTGVLLTSSGSPETCSCEVPPLPSDKGKYYPPVTRIFPNNRRALQTRLSHTLRHSYHTAEDMRKEFFCFAGTTGYPDPAKLYTQPTFLWNYGKGYYGDVFSTPWLADPTGGTQKYDQGCAMIDQLLVDNEKGGFRLRAQIGTGPPNSDAYQQSISTLREQGEMLSPMTLRLQGKHVFNGGLFVISVNSMPYGAGLWPAFWLTVVPKFEWLEHPNADMPNGIRTTWPLGGEIDIIEYVNANATKNGVPTPSKNNVNVHGPPGCTADIKEGERLQTTNCNADSGFQGCPAAMASETVGGRDFVGGVFACEWEYNAYVKCWYFRPDDVVAGEADMTYDQWFNSTDSISTADFPSTPDTWHDLSKGCDDKLYDMTLIINTVVCGQWPSNDGQDTTIKSSQFEFQTPSQYESSTSVCTDAYTEYAKTYSGGNTDGFLPSNFEWDVNYIRVFTP